MKTSIGIDLGTATVIAYVKGKGIVLIFSIKASVKTGGSLPIFIAACDAKYFAKSTISFGRSLKGGI